MTPANLGRPLAGEPKRSFAVSTELNTNAAVIGRALGVCPDIHEQDHMFGYLAGHLKHPMVTALGYYFNGGRDDAARVLNVGKRLGVIAPGIRFLEFAAGYGRVSRHLSQAMRDLRAGKYYTTDIHPSAVSFLKEKLGLTAIQSTLVPEELPLSLLFNYICVLSLFSHLPDDLFRRWLRVLYDHLDPGGFMLITTHGEDALKIAPNMAEEYDNEKGFGFARRSEQLDLKPDLYGTTVATPRYVIRAVYENTTGRIESFTPGCWFGIQDEWIIQKPKVK